jgi:hypothetical protein
VSLCDEKFVWQKNRYFCQICLGRGGLELPISRLLDQTVTTRPLPLYETDGQYTYISLDHFYGYIDNVCRRVARTIAFGHTNLFPEETRSIRLGTYSQCPFKGFPASPYISAKIVFFHLSTHWQNNMGKRSQKLARVVLNFHVFKVWAGSSLNCRSSFWLWKILSMRCVESTWILNHVMKPEKKLFLDTNKIMQVKKYTEQVIRSHDNQTSLIEHELCYSAKKVLSQVRF